MTAKSSRKVNFFLQSKKISFRQRCPHCSHHVYHRSRRDDWLEKLLSLFGLYPFRCENYCCNRRFLMFSRR